MSKYTTEVRYICEYYAGVEESAGMEDVEEIIDRAKNKIFPNYPIWDESYRNALNQKILRHYYMREIGDETVGLFKLHLSAKMNEIMPYYNELYKSAVLEFNPFYDVDYERKRNVKNDGGSVSNSESVRNGEENGRRMRNEDFERNSQSEANDSENRSVNSKANNSAIGSNESRTSKVDNNEETRLYSDTPQSGIENLDGNPKYLTNVTKNGAVNTVGEDSKGKSTNTGTTDYVESGLNSSNSKSESKDNGSNNVSDVSTGVSSEKSKRNDTTMVNNTEEYVEKVKGKMSGTSYAKLLKEFRETIINIDMMIIDELKPLFFGLF